MVSFIRVRFFISAVYRTYAATAAARVATGAARVATGDAVAAVVVIPIHAFSQQGSDDRDCSRCDEVIANK